MVFHCCGLSRWHIHASTSHGAFSAAGKLGRSWGWKQVRATCTQKREEEAEAVCSCEKFIEFNFLKFNTDILRYVCFHKTYDFFALLETFFFSVLWRLILPVSLPLDSNAVSKLCLHSSALGLSPSTSFILYPCFLHSPLFYSLFIPLWSKFISFI